MTFRNAIEQSGPATPLGKLLTAIAAADTACLKGMGFGRVCGRLEQHTGPCSPATRLNT